MRKIIWHHPRQALDKGAAAALLDSVKQSQRFTLDLEHNSEGRERLADNEEPIVWHEQILDEYWNRLEEICHFSESYISARSDFHIVAGSRSLRQGI